MDLNDLIFDILLNLIVFIINNCLRLYFLIILLGFLIVILVLLVFLIKLFLIVFFNNKLILFLRLKNFFYFFKILELYGLIILKFFKWMFFNLFFL